MKKKTLIFYIILTLLILTFFILLTVFDREELASKKESLGNINKIYDNTDNIKDEKYLQYLEGDEGAISDEYIPLICHISDKNNSIIGSDFLPFIAQVSYHDKLTSFLLGCGYSGEIDLIVIDDSVFKANQFYYYSFQITDSNEIVSCSFDEMTLQFEMNIY